MSNKVSFAVALLSFILLSVCTQSVYAATVRITLTNSQSSPTGANFQQMISFNALNYTSIEASNLGNIRFYQAGNELYSWCDTGCTSSSSNAIFWVKIPNGISGSGGTAVINMTFESLGTNYDGVYAGEAPGLSPNYAQYDNGANVFALYFDGNTNPSDFSAAPGISVAQATGVTYGSSTINAILITGYDGNGYSYNGFSFTQGIPNTRGVILESNFQILATQTDMGAVSLVDNAIGAYVFNAISTESGGHYFSQRYIVASVETADANPQGTATGAWIYATLVYPGNSIVPWNGITAPQLYSASGGYSGTNSINPIDGVPTLYMGLIGSLLGPTYVWDEYLDWMRARYYPPAGVMPAAAFNSSLVSSSNTLTLSSGNIEVGSTATANVVLFAGALGGYSGQFSWFFQNQTASSTVNTIGGFKVPEAIAFNPSGTLAYVANEGGTTVNVVNVAQNMTVNTITGFSTPLGVVFSPSGALAYVSSYNAGNVKIVNVVENQVVNTISGFTNPQGIALNPSGTLLYVTNEGGTTVSVVNTATNTIVNTITGFAEPDSVAFTPSGALAYVTNEGLGSGKTVNVINVAQNITVNTITGFSEPQDVAFNPSGTIAYVTNAGSGLGTTVSVVNVAQNRTVNTIYGFIEPYDVAFNPSGTLAYVTSAQGTTVNVINVAQNRTVNTITGFNDPYGVLLNPSGTLAYVTNFGSGGTGKTVNVIGNLQETSVQSLPLSPSGLLQLSIYAKSSNTIVFTFNGVQYTATSGSGTIYGTLDLYGFGEDNGTNLYGYGSNTILVSNSLTIGPYVPTTTTTIPQNNGVQIQGSGGTGAYVTTQQTTKSSSSTTNPTTSVAGSVATTAKTTIPANVSNSTTPTTIMVTSVQNTTTPGSSATTTVQNSSGNAQPGILQQIWDAIANFFSHL